LFGGDDIQSNINDDLIDTKPTQTETSNFLFDDYFPSEIQSKKKQEPENFIKKLSELYKQIDIGSKSTKGINKIYV